MLSNQSLRDHDAVACYLHFSLACVGQSLEAEHKDEIGAFLRHEEWRLAHELLEAAVLEVSCPLEDEVRDALSSARRMMDTSPD